MNISTFSFCFTVRRPFYQVKGVQFKWVKRLDDRGGKSNFHLCRGLFKKLKNRFFKISKKLVEITFSYEASVDSVAFRQFTKKKSVFHPRPKQKLFAILLFSFNGRDQLMLFLLFLFTSEKFVPVNL